MERKEQAFYRTISIDIDIIVKYIDLENPADNWEWKMSLAPDSHDLRETIKEEVRIGNFKVKTIGESIERD